MERISPRSSEPAAPAPRRRAVAPAVLLAGAVLALALSPASAPAQRVQPGAQIAAMTDISGTMLTSSDMLAQSGWTSPGLRNYTCPVAWGVRTTADTLVRVLRARALETPPTVAGRPLAPEAQQRVLELMMTDVGDDSPTAEAVQRQLTPTGNQSRAAQRAADRLVEQLAGLLAASTVVDPERPGRQGQRSATKLDAAVRAFNRFVEVSSPEFLRAPSDDFLAAQAILARLVATAQENEGREEFAVGGPLACAPLAIEERPFELCLLLDDELREVRGLVRPATGDTLVEVNGQRRPFREVYPTTTQGYAAESPWFADASELRIAGVQYLRFGLPTVVRPQDVRRVGEHQGVSLFARIDESSSTPTLYLPTRPGCEVQPYRPAPEVRRVRG